MKTKKEIKNIKIDPSVHEILKKYCDKRGIKIYKFLENLILEKCKEKKDIYGEIWYMSQELYVPEPTMFDAPEKTKIPFNGLYDTTIEFW